MMNLPLQMTAIAIVKAAVKATTRVRAIRTVKGVKARMLKKKILKEKGAQRLFMAMEKMKFAMSLPVCIQAARKPKIYLNLEHW
jgi:hypothetical protein